MRRKHSLGAALIVLACVAWMVSTTVDWVSKNWYSMAALAGFALIVTPAYFLVRYLLRRANRLRKFSRLMRKYKNDEATVNKILEGKVWSGQTDDQLREALGEPESLDSQLMDAKTTEVWRYLDFSKGYAVLNVKIENGLVVGWDRRSQ